jgi:hypothetical protein
MQHSHSNPALLLLLLLALELCDALGILPRRRSSIHVLLVLTAMPAPARQT